MNPRGSRANPWMSHRALQTHSDITRDEEPEQWVALAASTADSGTGSSIASAVIRADHLLHGAVVAGEECAFSVAADQEFTVALSHRRTGACLPVRVDTRGGVADVRFVPTAAGPYLATVQLGGRAELRPFTFQA